MILSLCISNNDINNKARSRGVCLKRDIFLIYLQGPQTRQEEEEKESLNRDIFFLHLQGPQAD